MVGRLAPWKGQDVFLRAFAKAFPNGEATAVIAGSAMFGEDEFAVSVQTLVEGLCVAGRVTLAGFVDDVPALLSDTDVLVHASVLPEPFGQVIIEAMAAGCAVIASDAGGPSEIVTNEIDGLLVRPGDVEALGAALRRLLAGPELRQRLAKAGLERAEDFLPGKVAGQVAELQSRIVSAAG
jgi:glycosyltransferase involved in cell wall biosynthesis